MASSPARRRHPLASVLVPAAVLVVGLAGCGGGSEGASGGGPLVVVTTTQLADFAREVGGDDIEVHALLRPNVDAHDFEPTPRDIDALARAAVIVQNGVGFEPWLEGAVEASGTDAPVVDASEGVELLDGGHDEDDHGDEGDHDGDDHGDEGNPHIWFDPANAEAMVENLVQGILDQVPAAGDRRIRQRADAYVAELRELDAWIEQQIGTLDDPLLVTDHDAFPYYVERYDITYVGSIIPSFDSSAEVSASDLNDLADRIEETGVQAIFTEQSLPPKAAEALARRTDVEVVTGDDGLYGDALGPEGSPGETYLGMMRHNTATIVEHLS